MIGIGTGRGEKEWRRERGLAKGLPLAIVESNSYQYAENCCGLFYSLTGNPQQFFILMQAESLMNEFLGLIVKNKWHFSVSPYRSTIPEVVYISH